MDDADRRLAEIVARKHASDQKKAAEAQAAAQKAGREKQIAKEVVAQLPERKSLMQAVVREINEQIAPVNMALVFQDGQPKPPHVAAYTIGVKLEDTLTGFEILMNVDAQGVISGYIQADLMHQPLRVPSLLELREDQFKSILVEFLDKCVK
jgi:hypothetical protein